MITKALIYKVQDYRESSKLLFVLTPQGKYTLVGKGVKNYKNPYHHLADYLNLIELDLTADKSIQTLKGAKLIASFDEIKANYEDLKTISYLTKVIDDVIVNDDILTRFFDLIIKLLEFENKKIAYLTFLIKLTYALGLRMSFNKPNIVGFNIKTGQVVNKGENLKIDLQLKATVHLQIIYYSLEEQKLEPEIQNQLFSFIKAYYNYHLDYKIKQF